jgi:hypothetical protein
MTLAVLAVVLAFAAAVHAVMEPIATWAESDRGMYLWKDEEWLQVFTRERYEGRGAGRLLVYGPSETREAIIPEKMDAALPGLSCLQNAQSVGTIEDGLVLLEFIEREYGRAAVPAAIVLGVTTRFAANIRPVPSPLFTAIDKYAPNVRVDAEAIPPRLVPRTAGTEWLASFRFRLRQQTRYRGALKVLILDLLTKAGSGLANDPTLLQMRSPAKYYGFPRCPEAETRAWLVDPSGFWHDVHAWNPDADRERVLRDLRAWRAFCDRHGTELFVVNMPEISWNRDLYAEGRYERYLSIVREGLGDTPFLDLRLLLANEEFFDSCHPNFAGCERVTDAVTALIALTRASRKGGGR